MRFRYIITVFIVSYLLIVANIMFFYTIDIDMVALSNVSFVNMLLFIVLIFIFALSLLIVYYRKIKRLEAMQISLIEQNSNVIIDEFKDDQLIKLLNEKNIFVKENIILQNEKQNMWIHDIKIPLTTLNLFIENQRNKLSDDQIKILENISLNLDNDINKKIIYDKIELQIDDYKINHFNIKDVIISVIRKFRVSFNLKNLAVDVTFDALYIYSDIQMMTYILEQIISNAI